MNIHTRCVRSRSARNSRQAEETCAAQLGGERELRRPRAGVRLLVARAGLAAAARELPAAEVADR